MLAVIVVVLEIAALVMAVYTMINVNAVCNDYLKRHQSADNVQKTQTSDSVTVNQSDQQEHHYTVAVYPDC